jgi:hypothetical protein
MANIPGIVISCILGILLVLYFFFMKYIKKDIMIFVLFVLEVISIFFIFFCSDCTICENYETLEQQYTRPLFQVSAERKKCMIEKVSLCQPPAVRSSECCSLNTVGGKLPMVEEWKSSYKTNLWNRVDNYTTNPNNIALKTQLPPTDFVQK